MMGNDGKQSPQGVNQVVLNKKIMGTRKRNREKSYESYNQKLQLPPMINTPKENAERQYAVPNQGKTNASNSHHAYMMPLSPVGGQTRDQQPKTSTHAQIQQRQSINEGLASSPGNQITGQQIFTRFSNI